MNKRRSY